MNNILPERFEQSLAQQLFQAYVIYGPEHLLRIEALDALRGAAQKDGYLMREMFTSEGARTDWQAFNLTLRSQGLFSDKRLIELHIPKGLIPKDGQTIVENAVKQPPSNTVIALVFAELDNRQMNDAWLKKLVGFNGVASVKAQTVDLARLPTWIQNRLKKHGLSIESDALQLLSERLEGNLLAAKQEVEKLALLHPKNHTVSLEDAQNSVADVARFDVFQLASAWMSADVARTVRLLESLEASGGGSVLILWAISEDIRLLINVLANEKRSGEPVRLWGDKAKLAPKAAHRLGVRYLLQALQTCAKADRQLKGAESGDVFDTLSDLLIGLASGKALPHSR